MQELRLISATDNGAKLLLRSGDGSDYTLVVDERLRAAVRGDRVRMGQLEIAMDLSLRPRDIQARIRAGESAEQVAATAKIPLDRVRRYEGPVLAEREHMAWLARRTAIRSSTPADGPPVLLGDLVERRLRDLGSDPETATWDSWRRDDGRWQIRVGYQVADAAKHGDFVFDPGRRAVAAEGGTARTLLADQRATTGAAAPGARRYPHAPDGYETDPEGADEGTEAPATRAVSTRKQARRARKVAPLAAKAGDARRGDADDRTAGDPAGELAGPSRIGVPAMAGLISLASSPPRQPMPGPASLAVRSAADESARHRVTSSGRSSRDRRPHVPAIATAPIRRTGAYDDRIITPTDRPPTRESVRGKRTSVPSWDEILFGPHRQQDS
ncbi:MAG TPA: septation protein SepH [Actinomycetes bacterium]|nr:septation protein SepH [Actinomycetes bacterium]